jgi:predicted glycosyltransferase
MITKKLNSMADIAQHSIALNETVDWWKKEMESVVRRVEELNEQDPFGVESNEEREELDKKIEYLSQKGEFENKNITDLNDEIDSFVKDSKSRILSQLVSRAIEKTKRQKGT